MDENERFWNENAERLRRFKGLCPLTPDEAKEAMSKMPQRDASGDEVDSILDAVLKGRLPDRDLEDMPDWISDVDFEAMDREAALCRNRGEHDPQGDEAENDLFNELMKDEHAEQDKDELGR